MTARRDHAACVACGPRPRRRRGRAAAALVAAGLLAASCSSDAATPDTGDGASPTLAEGAPSEPDRDTPPQVAGGDPIVAMGSCTDLTYTPPGAPTPQEGELCRPPAGGPRHDVGVVLLHGGSGIGGRWSDLEGWVTAYLGAGFTTLNVDYELFRPGDDEPVFPRPEQDVKAAVQYLRRVAPELGLSPDRIVVHGTSSGARIGAVAFTTPGDEAFEGPELWEGVSDRVDAFIGFYHPYDGSLQNASTYYGGERDDEETEVRRRWVLADALLHADAATGPAVFVTGDRDWEIQVTQAEEFAAAVRRGGDDAEVLVIPRAGHGFDIAGGALTTQGEQVAYAVTQWLSEQFPRP